MEHRLRIRAGSSWQRKSYLRGRARRLAFALLVAVVPVLLAISLAYYQSEKGVEEQALAANRFALGRFEVILNDATSAAKAVAPLAGMPCSDAERALRYQTVAWPLLRSVNLVKGGTIYCASVSGAYAVPEEAQAYVDGRLRLMAGNSVTPDRAVLIYRVPDGPNSVLIGVDGRHLSDVLKLVGDNFADVQMIVGPMMMTRDGKVEMVTPLDPSQHGVTLKSLTYPMSVRMIVPEGATWRHFNEHYRSMILLLAVLGMIAAVLTYRLSLRSLSPRAEIVRALAANEFIPYYQPVVRADTGEWSGVEVLLRWQHPVDGMIPADLFIPYIERSGLIVPITEHIIERCRTDLVSIAGRLTQGFHVGINISAAHCNDLSLVEPCRAFLAAFGARKVVLVLELTERELIEPSQETGELFAQLHGLGAKLAIDDFGTGHSSFAYLQNFNIDYLKIDRSFVAAAGSEELSEQILASIIDLANRLGLETVAEGVETIAQRDNLTRRGVDYLQGFLFARPMPLKELVTALGQAPRPVAARRETV